MKSRKSSLTSLHHKRVYTCSGQMSVWTSGLDQWRTCRLCMRLLRSNKGICTNILCHHNFLNCLCKMLVKFISKSHAVDVWDKWPVGILEEYFSEFLCEGDNRPWWFWLCWRFLSVNGELFLSTVASSLLTTEDYIKRFEAVYWVPFLDYTTHKKLEIFDFLPKSMENLKHSRNSDTKSWY